MSHPGQKISATDREARDDKVVGVATALVIALRTIAIYPTDHPRVGAAVTGLVGELEKHADQTRWLTLRLRGDELGFDGVWIAAGDRQFAWLGERLRAASSCGIEFGPGCRVDDLVAFAAVLARHSVDHGEARADWPRDHPRLRMLDLVFDGHHAEGETPVESEAAGRSASARSGKADAHRNKLLACLGGSDLVQQRLTTIERGCGGRGLEEKVEVDLLAVIADLLPVDIADDDAKIVGIAAEILDRVQAEILQGARGNAKIDSDGLIETALEVAKRFMKLDAPQQGLPLALPAGRPEDDRIAADVGLLLAEYAALPESPGIALMADADTPDMAPVLGAELLGIHLHTLARTQRPEVVTILRQNLPALLATLDADRLAVLDAYLLPSAPGRATRIGDPATLRTVAFLEQFGLRALIVERGYCPAALVRRTFPESLPVAARILGETPSGRAILSQALGLLGPGLQSGGADLAAAAGILSDVEVIRALVAVGVPSLTLLAAAAANAVGEARELLVGYAQKLRLPPGEAAVLRWVDSDDLPSPYLHHVLGAAATRNFDEKLQAKSASVLRTHIERRRHTLPPDRLLGAIDSLREVPGAATAAFLQRLATEGRFTRLRATDRAVRRAARRVLAIPGLFGARSP